MNSMLRTNTTDKQPSLNRRASKIISFSVAALLLASLLCAQAGPAGHWEAEITGDGSQRIRVSLDLAKNAKSEWIASMGLPAHNKTGLVVKDVAVNGKSVKFIALELMSTPFDTGKFKKSGRSGGLPSPRPPWPLAHGLLYVAAFLE